jgi:uncharacterized protein with FMN-binding domain
MGNNSTMFGACMKSFFQVTVSALLLMLMIFFSACAGGGNQGPPIYKPGVYRGEGEGEYGPVRLAVTVSARNITGIEVLEHGETPGLGTAAFEELTRKIIAANSLDLDALSGASGSSRGFLEAVEAALALARL